MDYLEAVSKKTRSLIWVFDRGFNNGYLMEKVLDLGRIFVLRIDIDRLVLVEKTKKEKAQDQSKKKTRAKYPDRKKKRIDQLLKPKKAIETKQGKVWILENVLINSWLNIFVKECSIIVFQRKAFKTPLVILVAKKNLTAEEAFDFIDVYLNRWSIETIFKEVKNWFDLEKFKVTKEKNIYKFVHLCLFAYTLLSDNLRCLNLHLQILIVKTLKKYRNIKELCLGGLKLFLEMIAKNFIAFNPDLRL